MTLRRPILFGLTAAIPMSGELSRAKCRTHLERDPGHAAEHVPGPTITVSGLGQLTF